MKRHVIDRSPDHNFTAIARLNAIWQRAKERAYSLAGARAVLE